MEKRAAAAGETRRRIAEAAYALHSEKGAASTSWQEIAERAGVAVGTVYYHYPTFDELIPACTGHGASLYPMPTTAIFDGLRGRRERLTVLAEALFTVYAGMRGALSHAYQDRRTIPQVAAVMNQMQAEFCGLVRAAVGTKAGRRTIAAAEAMLDFRVWEVMTEQGLSEAMIKTIVVDGIAGCR